MDFKTITIAIVAGVAAALAVAAAMQMGPLGVPLLIAGAFPVYLATLSWGTSAGVVASVTAIFVTAGLISTPAAVSMGLLFSIPASVIGHQANLAQQNDQGTLEWYPLSNLFFNLCTVLVIGILATGYFVGYDAEVLTPNMTEAVGDALRNNSANTNLGEADIQTITAMMLRLLPFMFSGMWLIAHLLNLYLATWVARSSGMMPRPRDDIPANAGLPAYAVAFAVASVVLAVLLEGAGQQIAGVVAGIFIMAFALIGLANLHLKARGNPAGLNLLIVCYAIIIFFYLPLLLFSVGGILRVLTNTNPNTPPPGGSNSI